ncbi:MAG TPA: hypothetical protein VG370_31365 [Chloroflexota bacterium]|jgi:hypothetical protein|nr:hypothetical protein [Chloroflexota bacterium]
MSIPMVKKLIAVVLAGALLIGTVGEAFAAKPAYYSTPGKAQAKSAWQVIGAGNGTWD